ncbi:MAG: hypothetical protein FWE50_03460 [Alphaproteobacteria bacterium]|nr:hypothetical protein [Alphaproteobacteria bacterium]
MKVLGVIKSPDWGPQLKGLFEPLGHIVLCAMVDEFGKRAGWSAKFPYKYIQGKPKYIITDVFDNQFDAYITAVCFREQGYVTKQRNVNK